MKDLQQSIRHTTPAGCRVVIHRAASSTSHLWWFVVVCISLWRFKVVLWMLSTAEVLGSYTARASLSLLALGPGHKWAVPLSPQLPALWPQWSQRTPLTEVEMLLLLFSWSHQHLLASCVSSSPAPQTAEKVCRDPGRWPRCPVGSSTDSDRL